MASTVTAVNHIYISPPFYGIKELNKTKPTNQHFNIHLKWLKPLGKMYLTCSERERDKGERRKKWIPESQNWEQNTYPANDYLNSGIFGSSPTLKSNTSFLFLIEQLVNSPDLSSLLRQVIPLAVFCIIHRACSISVNNSVCRERAAETPHATTAERSSPWSCQEGHSQMDNKPTVKIRVSAHTLALEISEKQTSTFPQSTCPEPWAGLSPHQIVCLRESLLV